MTAKRRVIVTGATGQLVRAITAQAGEEFHVLTLARPDVDIANWRSVRDFVDAQRPDVVVHAAAATNVDGCERDPEMAFTINAMGTRHVAQAAARSGATLVYISTNYVFNGSKSSPYHEWDEPSPISVYGASKLAGERECWAATSHCYIARTAWLYSGAGSNFVQTMLHLMSTRSDINVVADQYGNPTYARDLTTAVYRLIDRAPFGTYHLANAGIASWHEWASEIRNLSGSACVVNAIPGSEYVRDAKPPVNGGMTSLVAASAGISMPDWRDALRRCLTQ